MSEENKTIRLNKVAKEFNVGISTLVDFLAKKGKNIENNPNTKIDTELYNILSSAFQSERKVKEEASKLTFNTQKSTPTTIEAEEIHSETNSNERADDFRVDEIMIKSKTIDYIEPKTPKVEMAPEPVEEEVVVEKEVVVENEAIVENEIVVEEESKQEKNDDIEVIRKEDDELIPTQEPAKPTKKN